MVNNSTHYTEVPQVVNKTDIATLFREGRLGIRLKKRESVLEIRGEDEGGRSLIIAVEPNRIYSVSYLNMERELGLFDLDKTNSVVFRLDEDLWDYISIY